MNAKEFVTELLEGAALSQPDQNLLAKLATEYGVRLPADDAAAAPVQVQNRFSGDTVSTTPLVAALVAFIYAVNTDSAPITYRGKALPVSLYDRARYLVLKLDNRAYSALID